MASTGLAKSALQDLDAAAGTPSQLRILKTIKYDLTGHLSRKVEYIHNGLIPSLATLLSALATSPASTPGVAATPPHVDELALTQVAQVLCVIAHGQ